MQVPLQITMRNLDHSQAVEERVREKALKLNKFSDKIIACQVVIEQNQAYRQSGNLYNIRIHLSMPRKELIVNRNQQENLYLAIREAFVDMARQVEDADTILQGDVKHHSFRIHGEIARLFQDDQFGFIIDANGEKEYYFNANNLVKQHKFDQLKVGMPVAFVEEVGDEGLRASRICVRKEKMD
jgi:ribosomal subunit interface protein